MGEMTLGRLPVNTIRITSITMDKPLRFLVFFCSSQFVVCTRANMLGVFRQLPKKITMLIGPTVSSKTAVVSDSFVQNMFSYFFCCSIFFCAVSFVIHYLCFVVFSNHFFLTCKFSYSRFIQIQNNLL